MFLEIDHHIWLEYDGFIHESFVELRLQPKTTERQAVASFVLAVGPPARVHRYRDWNDNFVHHFTITNYHDQIEIVSRTLVETRAGAPRPELSGEAAALTALPHDLHDWLRLDGPMPETPRLRRFATATHVPRHASIGEQVHTIDAHIKRELRYEKNVTKYDSTTDDFLRVGGGVCQDFAHLMLAVLRMRGIPCRYVSGYLHVDSTGGPAQSHAWIEFHAPSHGWVPFDPTHHRAIDERYVVVAHGRHYDDVPPNKGIYRGRAVETLRTEVHTRVSPRKAVADLHEEIRHLDLPVYQEVPPRRPDPGYTAADEAAQQQQQQQQ